jgi:hypothetical protein
MSNVGRLYDFLENLVNVIMHVHSCWGDNPMPPPSVFFDFGGYKLLRGRYGHMEGTLSRKVRLYGKGVPPRSIHNDE